MIGVVLVICGGTVSALALIRRQHTTPYPQTIPALPNREPAEPFKQYENAAYGFSFGYPSNWKATDLNEDGTVLNFDSPDGSRMTVYTINFGRGVSVLLNKREEKTVEISGIKANEEIWVWDNQTVKAGQVGLMTVALLVKHPLTFTFQPASPSDLSIFESVLDTLKIN